jgi:ATP/maltotriose-dependent transcriptional regulator MalT
MVIPRPRLHALLDKALQHPFTLVSALAGFGKTTLLSTWARSLSVHNTGICWLSLDEEANLFVVSLDSRRQWYRYHALFAEALRYQLERRHADLVPVLHRRASQRYAQHQQTTLAILHAFEAGECRIPRRSRRDKIKCLLCFCCQ